MPVPAPCRTRRCASRQPRLPLENFYYAQEDEVYAAAARDRFTWTIHRPHSIIGMAVGNAMNMGTTLAVYASICKETGRPFQFPGSEAQWNGLSDVTDARMLARQLRWAADSDAARNEAFNIANGDYFRWSWLWRRLAAWFGVQAAGFDGTVRPLEAEMANDAALWREMARKPRPGRARPRPAGLGLAHRPRPGPADRGDDRHGEQPPAGFCGVAVDRGFVLRSVRGACGRSA